MNSKSDAQLLRQYADHGTEAAFTEIVTRHTDLVFSAALRHVNAPDIAAEVSQTVFVALARGAHSLSPRLSQDASLAGWLCRSARNLSLNHRRDEFRRHSRERLAMQHLDLISDAEPEWDRLRPLLDEAMAELNEPDYDALILRFFKNQDLRSIGLALGVTDDTAQKRVSRALERLRESLAKRGLTATATALSVAISAHAVQAAPAGLAAALSTASLSGITLTPAAATAAATTANTSVMTTMTTLKIGLLGAAVGAAAMASPLVIQHQTQSKLLADNAALLQQLVQSTQPAQGSSPDNAVPTVSSDTLTDAQLQELLSLRGEVTRLRQDSQELASLKVTSSSASDPVALEMNSWLARVKELKQKLDDKPDQKIPELQFLKARDWLLVALDARLDTDAGTRRAFARLRTSAKQAFAPTLRKALNSYVQSNAGQLPGDISDLKPYFAPQLDDVLLSRYQIVKPDDSGNSSQDQPVTEKAAVDKEFDSLMSIGLNGMSMKGEGGGGGFHFANSFSGTSQPADGSANSVTGSGGFGGGGFGAGSFPSGAGTNGRVYFYSGSGSTNSILPSR
jgi:RNA polymerase sigma factor (sigma-70 family)